MDCKLCNGIGEITVIGGFKQPCSCVGGDVEPITVDVDEKPRSKAKMMTWRCQKCEKVDASPSDLYMPEGWSQADSPLCPNCTNLAGLYTTETDQTPYWVCRRCGVKEPLEHQMTLPPYWRYDRGPVCGPCYSKDDDESRREVRKRHPAASNVVLYDYIKTCLQVHGLLPKETE